MVKLYVDIDKVKANREQYSVMKGLIEDWGYSHGYLKTEVADNTSGETTQTYTLIPEGMEDENFISLYNKVVGMALDLEQTEYKIKALLNRVAEFYDILNGEEKQTEITGLEYLCMGEPSAKVAYLDTKNQIQIIVKSTYVQIESENEKTALDNCCELLAKLQKVSVSYEDDKGTIEECIKKQKYVVPLCGAFSGYVIAVDTFNEEVAKMMAGISEDEYTPVTTRTYDFATMEAAGCDETIITQIAEDALKQAGITEEEKLNALNNGMSLYQLAFDTSLVMQGDALRGNNNGMNMWKLVLDGNYEDAFNTWDYSNNFSNKDNTLDIWYAIADYQMTSVIIDSQGNADCSVFEAMLNEEMQMSDAAIENLEVGAYYITMKKSMGAIIASEIDSDVYSEAYKDYSKTLALYNTIVLTNAKINEISGSFYDSNFVNYYEVSDMTLKFEGEKAVVNINVSERHTYYGMDATTEAFNMTVQSTENIASTLLGDSLIKDQELIDAVKSEQEKIVIEALKGGAYLVTDVAGYTTGVGGLYTGVLKFTFSALEADYTSEIKTGASAISSAVNLYSKSLDNKELAGKISTGSSLTSSALSDIIPIFSCLYENVFTNNGEEALTDTYSEINRENYALWFGSSALGITSDSNEDVRYSQNVTYVLSPEKYNNYQLIATGGGIAELMGWDEQTVTDVMQSSAVEAIENKTVDGIEITSEDIAGVINGGYDFTQDYAYTKFANIINALDTNGDKMAKWEAY